MKTFRVLVFLCLCALWGQAAGNSSSLPQAKPVRSGLSDAQLQQMIQAKFAKSKASSDGFTVKVSGGVATIDGKTNVVQRKGAATRMAKTAGAVAVVNRIQVSDAAKQKLAQQLAHGKPATVKP